MGDGGGVGPPHALAAALTERLAQPAAVHEAPGLDPASRTYIPALVVVAGPTAGPGLLLLAET
eukprot:6457725-Alexandrium_andersonii.AAC.1